MEKIIVEKSICSPAEHHVNLSASPENAAVWPTGAARLLLSSLNSLTAPKSNGSSGKMSPEFYQAPAGAILPGFSALSPAGECRRRNPGNGKNPASSIPPVADIPWRGVCLTLNLCEWTGLNGLSLRDEGVSSLSDIVHRHPLPHKYYLTTRACNSMLNRSERRGRKLPESLRAALRNQIRLNGGTVQKSPRP